MSRRGGLRPERVARGVPPVAVFAFMAVVAAMVGCDSRDAPKSPLVVYYSVDSAFATPILDEFTRTTGIAIRGVSDSEAGKTTGLANKLMAERASPRADVWWSSEAFVTLHLAAAGVFAPYRPATAGDIPERFRDPGGLWTAVGLRGRVIAYDPGRTSADDLPRRWADLADPRYKDRFAMADPRFGTTRGHMATLLEVWGPESLEQFFRGLRRNGLPANKALGNAHAVRMLAAGAVEFVATDTDDVIVAQERGDSIAMIYPDLDAPDGRNIPGTLWIPCTVAKVKGTLRSAAAEKLIDYLVSAEVEEKLARSVSRNVPVRPALCERIGMARPTMAEVDYRAAAASLETSDRLINEVLLQGA